MLLFFKRLFTLTAAELTVISFVLMSLLGGGLIYVSEHSRSVEARVLVQQVVRISPIGDATGLGEIVPAERIETHTAVGVRKQRGESFIDALFTAVSALCVTGLTSTDFSQFTLPGQIVTLLLIQMGGLGIILFTSVLGFAVFSGFSDNLSVKKNARKHC